MSFLVSAIVIAIVVGVVFFASSAVVADSQRVVKKFESELKIQLADKSALNEIIDQNVETIGVWKRSAAAIGKERDAAVRERQDLERRANDLQRQNDRLTLHVQRAREHLADLETATDST